MPKQVPTGLRPPLIRAAPPQRRPAPRQCQASVGQGRGVEGARRWQRRRYVHQRASERGPPVPACARLCGAGGTSLPPRDARRRGSAACGGCLRPARSARASRGPGLQPLRLEWEQVHLVACSAHMGPGWGCVLIASSSGACLETKEPMRNRRGLANSGAAGEMLRTAGSRRMVQEEWLDPSQAIDCFGDLSHVSLACAVRSCCWLGLGDAEGVQTPGEVLS